MPIFAVENCKLENYVYSDPTLYEDSAPQPEEKEFYTPEELRDILISDLKDAYGVRDAV